jgi:hypothetical protein
MNINYEISTLPTKYHLIIELFLIIVIVFMLVKCQPSINVDSQGLVKDTVLNMSLLPDGTLVVADPYSDEVITVVGEKPINHGPLKQLQSITLAVTEDSGEYNATGQKVGILDTLISSAMATKHNLPGHKYYNLSWRYGNVAGCTRYDITKYPPPKVPVGSCF